MAIGWLDDTGTYSPSRLTASHCGDASRLVMSNTRKQRTDISFVIPSVILL